MQADLGMRRVKFGQGRILNPDPCREVAQGLGSDSSVASCHFTRRPAGDGSRRGRRRRTAAVAGMMHGLTVAGHGRGGGGVGGIGVIGRCDMSSAADRALSAAIRGCGGRAVRRRARASCRCGGHRAGGSEDGNGGGCTTVGRRHDRDPWCFESVYRPQAMAGPCVRSRVTRLSSNLRKRQPTGLKRRGRQSNFRREAPVARAAAPARGRYAEQG